MQNKNDHLLFLNSPRQGEKFLLQNLPLVIGRAEPAGLIIPNPNISRRHAQLTAGAQGYEIEDLNSSNGTFVNGERLQGLRKLVDGDTLLLGNEIELRLVVAAPAPVAVPEPVAAPANPNATFVASPEKEFGSKTVFMQPVELPPASPPKLVVSTPGQDARVYTLVAPRLRIGRNADNEIFIDNRFVSRIHAELEKRGSDYYLIPSTSFNNSLLMNSHPVMEPTRLRNGARIRIGGYNAGENVTLDYLQEGDDTAQQTIQFGENNIMTIGRDKENRMVLPSQMVSRFHAELEKVGQRFRLRDLRSSNGTFVNGNRIDAETWVQPSDAIQIGPYRFTVDENEMTSTDSTSQGVQVEVFGMNKWVNKKLNIIQDISLVFKPREFIVVVGQSGGGKSTLVDAIAGYRPATHGKVIVNGTIDVYKEFDAIRSTIGYVPQKDIIHMELTVFQALDYAAQLRMPADTTREERIKQIEEVMQELDLSHRRDTQISQLSGGQQKRVSIGVELLTKPGLFFLDEPTSGLDPGMETELMHLMRRLADQGRTIIMITHATKNVMLADKVVFLARGGYLTWFGPPEEALTYFDQFRPSRDQRASPMEFDRIYSLLDNDDLGKGADWAERFRKSPAHQKYISEPLKQDEPSRSPKAQAGARKRISTQSSVSALRQFLILSNRNLKIMTRDKFSLILLILTAPLMGSLDFVLASGVGRSPTGFDGGNFNNVIITLIVLTNTSILTGGLAFMRELVKERDIYKRERMVNLKLSSYIFSKVWIALLLAIYQSLCFTIIRFTAFDMPGGKEELMFFFVTEFLLVMAGTMLGLFASALAPNANAAPLLLIMFLIPQMVLSGALVSLPEPVKAPASSRWAFQAVMAITGVGSDPAGDACWQKTKEDQDAMTLDEKNADCSCMGENALRQSSCNFPGLGQYYNEAIDTQDPLKPAEPGAQPTEPRLPPSPEQPADPNNLMQLQLYIKDLGDYNDKVSKLQDQYKSDINTWQDQQEQFRTDIESFQKELTELKVKRAIAVGSAEATIRHYKDDYGWTFINKNDRAGYMRILWINWLAQIAIIIILFVAVILLQKSYDVV